MAQEVVTEAFSVVGSFHQSRNIGEGEAVFVGGPDHSDVGGEGGEGLGGNFGPSGG